MENFNIQQLLDEGYFISTDQQLIDFDAVYNFLENESYWSAGVTEDRLRRAISNSFCFGIYQNNKQAGLARVVTDKATFAYLCDVFILTEHRGKGLSKWLVKTIREHPELQGIRRWMLATADAHGLYAQYGFSPITKADRWMEIFTPYQAQ